MRKTRFLSRFTHFLLDTAGITSGMKVLDVGTGIGDAAFLVAERVGPQGTVTGVDINPAMIDVARQRALAAGITNVTFLQGDLSQMALSEQFDAVVGRFILLYIQDRAALLRRLRKLLRPGGMVAFQELDLTLAGTTLPHAPVFGQAVHRIKEVFERAGLDTQGTNLFRVFLEAGLPAPEMDLVITVGGPDWAGHEQVAGVTGVAQRADKRTLHLSVQGELTEVIHITSQHDATSIETREPSLEEAFLRFYEPQQQPSALAG